jgi:hypothetical protein
MMKTRFKKISAGIYHTILKKIVIDNCTRISHFAKRTVGFREVPIIPQLANPQIRLKTSRTAISWRMPVWRRGYPTVRLGAPAKSKNLHSKIGRHVDLARVRYGTMQSERRRTAVVYLFISNGGRDPLINCRRVLKILLTLFEMRGRPAGRFLGDMTTPRRPVESLLQSLEGIFSQNFTLRVSIVRLLKYEHLHMKYPFVTIIVFMFGFC